MIYSNNTLLHVANIIAAKRQRFLLNEQRRFVLTSSDASKWHLTLNVSNVFPQHVRRFQFHVTPVSKKSFLQAVAFNTQRGRSLFNFSNQWYQCYHTSPKNAIYCEKRFQ